MPIDDFSKNLFTATRFAFTLTRLPSFEFFVQSLTLPGPTISITEQVNPFRAIQRAGDNVTYSELEVEFLVNEDLENWWAINQWIVGLGFPESYEEHRRVIDNKTSDGTINILDSAGNPKIRVEVQDMFPITLSPITFDSKDTNETPIVATASFAFQTYKFNYVNNV